MQDQLDGGNPLVEEEEEEEDDVPEPLQRLRNRRKGHRGVTTRLLGGANGIRIGATSPADKRARIIVQIDLINRQIDKLRDLDERIQEATPVERLAREIEAAEDYIVRLVQDTAELEQFVATLPRPAADVDDDDTDTTATSAFESLINQIRIDRNSHRLPKLDLPKFSGNILSWTSFWDSFRHEVHEREGLSNVSKFTFLRAQLSGDALRTINGFALNDANYPQAIAMLQREYGKPEKIADAHFRALQTLPQVADNAQSLRSFYFTLEGHVRSLLALGRGTDSYGSFLVCSILDKIHSSIRRDLIRAHKKSEWTLDELRKALAEELEIMESAQPLAKSTSSSGNQQDDRNDYTVLNSAVSSNQSNKSCHFCGDEAHKASDCSKFKSTEDRWKLVKKKKLCHNCLSNGHQKSDCRSKHSCFKCKQRHHSSLHTDDARSKPKQSYQPQQHSSSSTVVAPTPPATTAAAAVPPVSSATYVRSSGPVSAVHDVTSTVAISESSPILLQTAIAPVVSKVVIIDAHLLMDNGSQRTFITLQLQKELELPILRYDTVSISSFGSYNKQLETLPVVEFELITVDGERMLIQALVRPHIANPVRNRLAGDPHFLFKYLQGLRLAHPIMQDEFFHIDILIGLDYYYDIILDRIIRGSGPAAVESRLGYLLSGPTGTALPESSSSSFHVNVNEEFDISKFWRTDAIGILPEKKEDDWLNDYKRDKIFFSNGQFGAFLPWKPNHPPLDANLGVCQARTRTMVRRLCKNPSLLHDYDAILRDQVEKGYIELVKEDQPSTTGVHYINHHGVLKPESLTTPLRIVYDCSCRSRTGVSLNDCLEEGPPLQNNMLHLYIRFRLHQIGLLSDIQKAFHRILLDPSERDFFRFLFLSDPSDPESRFNIFRFVVVPFGANCSPFILHAVLQKLLDHQDSPVAKDLGCNTYVDNVVTGCSDPSSAIDYCQQAVSIMKKGGFNLHDWYTNDAYVFKTMNPEKQFGLPATVRVLGLIWNQVEDTISFPPLSLAHFTHPSTTKRDISRAIGTVFDPLGFLTPVTIRAKILFQELWMGKYGWDDPLPAEVIKKWSCLSTDLEQAVRFKIPRRYFPSAGSIQILHIFVDASQKAFGAAAYVSNGSTVSLVAAKTRVTSLEKRTLPQRELEAAELGTRLAETILTALSSSIHTSIRIEMWSDSQDVLYWLVSKKKLPIFVSNRVNIINAFNTKYSASWHYCPTLDNPADLFTRGITPEKLFSSTLWINGPSWILNEADWPKWSPRFISTMTVGADPVEPIIESISDISIIMDRNRFSKLSRLVRSTAFIFRFIRKCRESIRRRKQATQLCATAPNQFPFLSAKEFLFSLHTWIKSCQKSSFSIEIEYLRSNRLSKRPTLVRQLDLYLQDGVVKCGGRMENAEMGVEAKHPILLPKSDHFTNLIVQDVHHRIHHGGVSATVAALRESYWIPSARQKVRAILHRCVKCKLINGLPYAPQDPAPLPRERVWMMDPFTGTGVDLTGALHVRSELDPSQTIKVYIALFTCTSSRAVHLEVVEDLSAEKFLAALRRFSKRKSTPRIIYSDNATNFQSSAKTIREFMESEAVSNFCAHQGIQWRFITKRSPWHGGFWERLIGLTKTTLKKVIGRNRITADELRTVITDIEAALNDRPLTYVSTDFTDGESITPSHLLFGRRIIPFPIQDPPNADEESDPTFNPSAADLIGTVKKKKEVIHLFMEKGKHEYLSALREFHKQTTGREKEIIKPGDIVLVHDDKPRLLWKLAIVKSLIRGADEKVRSAVIQTTQGITNRAIELLYPLEVRAQEDPSIIQQPPVPPPDPVNDIKPDVPSDEDDDPGNPQPEPPAPQQLPPGRQPRRAALAARTRIAGWVRNQEDDNED